MSIIESSATALVRFTGLGIVVFNKEKQRGEIGIIRDDKHVLSVRIQQPRFKDGAEKDIVVYEDIAVYKDLPKTGVEIGIKGDSSSQVAGYDVYKAPGDFNRLESEDLNDYRWIVNLASLHGEKMVTTSREDRFPMSKLFINNGLFYVHKLDTDLFFEKVEKDAGGNEKSRVDFGFLGETIGVKIEGDAVKFSIKNGDAVETHDLVRVNGLPFRIEIKNMDYSEEAELSDMPEYNKYLANPNGTTYELEPKKIDSAASGDAVGVKVFCHPGDGNDGGGLRSIEDLEA
jgi:hypothetical protein